MGVLCGSFDGLGVLMTPKHPAGFNTACDFCYYFMFCFFSFSGSTDVQARALLCPLTGKGQPLPMPYRTMNVGLGADMDVCLTQFGHCNFVSAKHACIFYDDVSNFILKYNLS